MKKIILVFMLLLVGCSGKKEPSIAPKKDPEKDYIYTSKGDNLNLKDILRDNNRNEDFDLIISSFDSESSKNLKGKNLLDFEIIHINIDTPDALDIEKKLSKNDDQILNARSSAKSDIEKNINSFGWSSKILFDKLEDDDFLSLISLTNTLIYPGHSSMKIELISIEKSSGKYLSNSLRLERKNITLDSIIETIRDDFKTNSYVVDDQTFTRKINESVPEIPEDNVKYYKLPDSDSIIVHNKEITLVLYEYSGLAGDFTEPILYTITIKE